jgi:uncharacterized phage protein (TIGR01671 family)
MERQIKFRGKRIDDGKWIYGYLADVQEQYGYAEINSYFDDEDGRWETCDHVDVNTVGQFTGYNDDEGREIFEGDLIRYQYEDSDSYTGWHGLREVTDEVVFEYGSFRLKNTYPFNIDSLWDMNNPKVEVIGNIHEK